MNFSHGRSLKLLTLVSLCASLVFSCSKDFSEENLAPVNTVRTTETQHVVNTSKVIDFQIVAQQQMSKRISLPDFVKSFPEHSERTQLLASVDQILETSSGHWEFYSNFKLLFTLASPNRVDMQAINGQQFLFNTITLHTNSETKLTDAIRFNISDCQAQAVAVCDAFDAIIYVNTLSGTPRDEDQNQDQSQDKDQDQSQDKDQDVTQDKDQDKDQDKGSGDDGSDQTPPVTSGTVMVRF